MKAIIILLCWFTIHVNPLNAPILKVMRTTTDDQIKEIERQALQQYGIKGEVNVISRNANGEITDLKFIRFDKAGKEASSCSFDNFGLLIITRDG